MKLKKIQVLQKELAKTKILQSDYIKALAKLSDVQMDSETHTLIQELAETSLYITKWEKIIDETLDYSLNLEEQGFTTKIELGRNA